MWACVYDNFYVILESHKEVEAIVKAAVDHNVVIIPFGGNKVFSYSQKNISAFRN